jgi:hypothetical protein
MPTPSRRRWFQFALGAMFVLVTVFAVWLGWNVKQVHQRRAEYESWFGTDTIVTYWDHNRTSIPPRIQPIGVAIRVRLFGDMAFEEITLPQPDAAEIERVRALFPEARVNEGHVSSGWTNARTLIRHTLPTSIP